MKAEEANSIIEHLIYQLNANGFSEIVTKVNTRLEENYEENEFERNPNSLLISFLYESIDVLESLSNRNFNDLIKQFNKLNDGERRIETISVEITNQVEPITFDLKLLPDYEEIIMTFESIIEEIKQKD